MPKFLEAKLKKEYGAKSDVPYKIMNSMGAMHGSKETAKGKQMEQKHDKKPERKHMEKALQSAMNKKSLTERK